MSEFWKKAIIRASIGFVLGILVGLGFLSITGVEKYLAEKGMDGLVLYLALSGLLGAVGIVPPDQGVSLLLSHPVPGHQGITVELGLFSADIALLDAAGYDGIGRGLAPSNAVPQRLRQTLCGDPLNLT